MPWIVGYFENGNRSGQWQEYYQGTKILCRTEHWRNNKLNGIRKRFDRFGNLIEEIMFKDGKAVTKTNYSLEDSLVYVRKPIDSVLVFTEVFFEGSLIASGRERIHNPGNLQWFQNIELTALNSAAIQARDNSGNGSFNPLYGSRSLYNTPALVEYKKEGEWKYYKEYNYSAKKASTSMRELLVYDYRHFGQPLLNSLTLFEDKTIKSGYDSLLVEYADNNLRNFYGYGNNNFLHFAIDYYPTQTIDISSRLYRYNYPVFQTVPVVKECGEYNKANEKIGNWQYYTKTNKLYKKESYLIAWKED
jgi:antitoxin component YwqK of YwqJK toxin-antitoxin module